jgi:hypothetical protein
MICLRYIEPRDLGFTDAAVEKSLGLNMAASSP